MNSGIRKAVFFVLLLFVAYLAYRFMIKPANEDLASKRVQVDKRMAKLAEFEKATATVEDLGKQLEKLEEAIEYFKKAASGLPESKIINTNAAQAIIMHLKEKGKNDQHMYQALQYLDRVKKIDPSYKQYQSLLSLYEKLASSSPVPDK